MDLFEEQKEIMIDLIEWYRDQFHKKDFGHTKMIEQVRAATNYEELQPIERMLELWKNW